MNQPPDRSDLYHGLFRWHTGHDGRPRVSRRDASPTAIPCPTTGRSLRVATLEAEAAAICPSCAVQGKGGFVHLVVCLEAAPVSNGGRLFLAAEDGERSYDLRVGDAILFDSSHIAHWTSPLVATHDEPQPVRIVSVGRYYL